VFKERRTKERLEIEVLKEKTESALVLNELAIKTTDKAIEQFHDTVTNGNKKAKSI
jgi:NAD kinase